jgi:hypothetical protein
MISGRVIRVTNGVVAIGWRAWTVQDTGEGLRLGSVIHDAIWEPRQLARASCEESHRAPNGACNCGFHAARDPVDVFSYLRGRDELRTIGRVLGEVLLGGKLVETDVGWRAAQAYPLRLYVEGSELANALGGYGVPVLSPAWRSASATSSTPASGGSSTSSWSVAPTRSLSTAGSG